MRVLACIVTHNCAEMLPWFLRHYDGVVDEVWAWDDSSDDGTREVLKKHPKVRFQAWPYSTGLHEDLMLGFCYQTYPLARGKFDFVLWLDPDEFIYAPDVRAVLQQALDEGYESVRTRGFNILGDGMPADDGKSQIYELLPMGVHAPIYSKPVVFRPEAHVRFKRGKHEMEDCDPKITPEARLKLFHVRYLGKEYTRRRNAQNYDRLGQDKGPGWSTRPDHDGAGPAFEGTPSWSEWAKQFAFNVLEARI